ncbi:hypothetical protein PIB30_088481 [Stylosanthes scabra]|uniref:Uncharacterized protein n=1 Tax=Stylosanthes scabra TaxID=79078 RepID=A0ABU6TT82_9FABA|nr:hypothetical protein [Stylosanthes scabra]
MALLIYTLLYHEHIHLGRIINNSMYHATTGASDQRLPFPVLITWMAAANDVPTYPDDKYIIIEGMDKFFPFEMPPSSSCPNLLQKILRKLRRRKKDLRNIQYMIRTARDFFFKGAVLEVAFFQCWSRPPMNLALK